MWKILAVVMVSLVACGAESAAPSLQPTGGVTAIVEETSTVDVSKLDARLDALENRVVALELRADGIVSALGQRIVNADALPGTGPPSHNRLNLGYLDECLNELERAVKRAASGLTTSGQFVTCGSVVR